MKGATLPQAREAKPKAAAWFRDAGEVTGVGITRHEGGYAVKVNLRRALPPSVEPPEHIDGVPIEVAITGSVGRTGNW